MRSVAAGRCPVFPRRADGARGRWRPAPNGLRAWPTLADTDPSETHRHAAIASSASRRHPRRHAPQGDPWSGSTVAVVAAVLLVVDRARRSSSSAAGVDDSARTSPEPPRRPRRLRHRDHNGRRRHQVPGEPDYQPSSRPRPTTTTTEAGRAGHRPPPPGAAASTPRKTFLDVTFDEVVEWTATRSYGQSRSSSTRIPQGPAPQGQRGQAGGDTGAVRPGVPEVLTGPQQSNTTSRSRCAAADRPGRARGSPPGAARAATGTPRRPALSVTCAAPRTRCLDRVAAAPSSGAATCATTAAWRQRRRRGRAARPVVGPQPWHGRPPHGSRTS
jgi:hypothetical protein